MYTKYTNWRVGGPYLEYTSVASTLAMLNFQSGLDLSDNLIELCH